MTRTPLFHDEFTNGTWLVTVAFFTPMARRLARSVRVGGLVGIADADDLHPDQFASARPLTSRTCSKASLMMNRRCR